MSTEVGEGGGERAGVREDGSGGKTEEGEEDVRGREAGRWRGGGGGNEEGGIFCNVDIVARVAGGVAGVCVHVTGVASSFVKEGTDACECVRLCPWPLLHAALNPYDRMRCPP